LIAKAGKANPYTLMRYLAAQLTILNPIIPHFAQYCWNKYVYPVLSKSSNFDPFTETLITMPWPTVSAPNNKVSTDRLKYLKNAKGDIREGLEKAKKGGKKPKKGAEAAPA
jgi:leucyl-tRNA synthetase